MGHKTIIMNLIKGQEIRKGTDRCGREKQKVVGESYQNALAT